MKLVEGRMSALITRLHEGILHRCTTFLASSVLESLASAGKLQSAFVTCLLSVIANAGGEAIKLFLHCVFKMCLTICCIQC